MQEKFGDEGFHVVAVNAWNEPASKVEAFAKENQLSYTILLKGRDVFKGPYRGKGIPHNYLIDGNGRIIHSELGWSKTSHAEFEKRIKRLLQ